MKEEHGFLSGVNGIMSKVVNLINAVSERKFKKLNLVLCLWCVAWLKSPLTIIMEGFMNIIKFHLFDDSSFHVSYQYLN